MTDQRVNKENILDSVGSSRSPLQKYQDFFVGTDSLRDVALYELAHTIASPMPGAAGYMLRRLLMLRLLHRAGPGVHLGRNVVFRHPHKISIGDRTAIDDFCLLDARGTNNERFIIGSDVLIARGTVIASKTDRGEVHIGDHCTIGKGCIFSSTGGIRIGDWVGIADTCYLGGGRYRVNRKDVPMMKQELYTEGPVIIGEDCWIGTGVCVLDGVKIGRGSIIGAGAVVREDVPEFTVVTPHQRLVMLPRTAEEAVDND